MLLRLHLKNFVFFEFLGGLFDYSYRVFAILDSPQNLKHFQSFSATFRSQNLIMLFCHVVIKDVYIAESDTENKD